MQLLGVDIPYLSLGEEGDLPPHDDGDTVNVVNKRIDVKKRRNDVNLVQESTAAFIADISILSAARLLHTVQQQNPISQLQEFVLSEAFSIRLNEAFNTPDELIKGTKDWRLTGDSAAEAILRSSMKAVQIAAGDLEATLSSRVPELEGLLNGCNTLLVGQGPQNEYLLDICSQKGLDCIEAEASSHVSCCQGIPSKELQTLTAAAGWQDSTAAPSVQPSPASGSGAKDSAAAPSMQPSAASSSGAEDSTAAPSVQPSAASSSGAEEPDAAQRVGSDRAFIVAGIIAANAFG